MKKQNLRCITYLVVRTITLSASSTSTQAYQKELTPKKADDKVC
jgi:hypothetical protein